MVPITAYGTKDVLRIVRNRFEKLDFNIFSRFKKLKKHSMIGNNLQLHRQYLEITDIQFM